MNPNSHLTAKVRHGPSLPTRELWARRLIVGKVLDFGSGFGADARFLRNKGIDVTEYDPYYSPQYPIEKYDTIICNYVLNVLLPEEQSRVLMEISEALKPTGTAYFSVRRDIQRSGFRLHLKHGHQVYQCRVVLPYRSLMKAEHFEIYEYQHFNQLAHQSECPFCTPDASRELVTEAATVYAMLDKYPVAPGHTLIIPKQHCADYFALPERTKHACWLVVDHVQISLAERFSPDGFNIGINIGAAAGQTVPHVHIHLIPRYQGDTSDPRGGVRGVIPERRNYVAL